MFDRFSFTSLFKFLTIAFALLLLAAQIYHTLNYPIWRDDAGFAGVAKSLANGDGYDAVLYDKDYPFYSSLGPVSILPAAFLMLFFGNQYWVPGVATIALIWIVIAAIFFACDKFFSKEKKWVFCFLTLSLTLLFSIRPNGGYAVETGDGLILWHLLMGEVLAGLLVILAALLLLLNQNSKKKIFYGALVLGLAMMTKTITAIAVAVILLSLAVKILFDKNLKKPQQIFLIIMAGLVAIAPALLLELVKFISMEREQYLEFQHLHAEAYKHNALVTMLRDSNGLAIFPDVKGHLLSLFFVFGLSSFIIIPATIYIAYVSYQENKGKNNSAMAGIILIFCFLLHVIWWMFFSFGSERHLIAGLFYFLAGLSLLLASIDYRKLSQAGIIAIVFSVFLLFLARENSFNYLVFDGFKKNPRLQEQLEVTKAIENLEKEGVVMISCGENFELEYLLPRNGHFRHCADILTKSFDRPVMLVNYFVVRDLVLSIEYDEYYGHFSPIPKAILARCNREYLKTKNFSLFWCDAKKQH